MNPGETPDINTVLPQAPESERALLAAFSLDPATVGAMCAERQIDIAHFHIPAHALLFRAMMDAWIKGAPMDFVTLSQLFRDRGQLEEVGGASAITELFTLLPTAAMASDYADICEEKRLLRALWTICGEYGSRVFNAKVSPQALVEEAGAKLCAITTASATIAKPKTPAEIATEATHRAQERIESRGLADYTMRTGIKQLDEAMSGIRPGDFILVSGKEKSGKTSLAFNIMEHIVFEQGKRAIAVSLEMKLPEIADRMIASIGRINFTNILNGWMSNEESDQFVAAAKKMSGGKFQIRDDLFSLPQIIAALRQHKAAHPDLEFAIIDYLQLVDSDKVGKDDSREQIIAKTSRTLRRAAGELNLGMLLLVQLNEDGQVRESRAPGMDCTAHIRIEPSEEEGLKWARVVYQRNGPSNVGVPVTHLGQFLRFEQAHISEQRFDAMSAEPKKSKKKRWDQC